ncbi:MAG: hypothetical protein J6A21_09300 [Lentisphaeria bacterium]|nr:hypothetical protein [Lentisphaeria bacterium]
MNILGVSALYHDSAACLVREGEILAAAQEERFSRIRHDRSLPVAAMDYCLREGKLSPGELDAVVFYDNPFLALDRFCANLAEEAPDNRELLERSFSSFFGDKLWIHEQLKKALGGTLGKHGKLLTVPHHYSHASSAFYPSPFEEAAILTVDGVGEWATTCIFSGEKDGTLTLHKQLDYPHSLGLLYSAMTYFCGFKVNSGEYKLMGLAPYGRPVYSDLIREKLVSIREDGSFTLRMEYFTFQNSRFMCGEKMEALFGGKARRAESLLTRREMDIASSIQAVTEEILLKLAKEAARVTGKRFLALAGGVALNCVANGKLRKSGLFDDIWVQPAAGDAGGALGCALYASVNVFREKRFFRKGEDAQKGSYLGPEYSMEEIRSYLDGIGADYTVMEEDALAQYAAERLARGAALGLFRNRMEFGPRALGARSIVADPRREDTQKRLNLKVKFRESFRPFAPAVLAEKAKEYFDTGRPEGENSDPYMLFTCPVAAKRRLPFDLESSLASSGEDLLKTVSMPRSDIPAVTHVDYSARVQSVDGKWNPFFRKLLEAFEKKTSCACLVNTSFNVRGEPIVNTPEDAYTCFMTTDLDLLVMENCVLEKKKQKPFRGQDRRKKYALD